MPKSSCLKAGIYEAFHGPHSVGSALLSLEFPQKLFRTECKERRSPQTLHSPYKSHKLYHFTASPVFLLFPFSAPCITYARQINSYYTVFSVSLAVFFLILNCNLRKYEQSHQRFLIWVWLGRIFPVRSQKGSSMKLHWWASTLRQLFSTVIHCCGEAATSWSHF